MALNQRNRIVIRCIVAALWLLKFIVAPSTETVYLLPILALFSFFLVDYFSGFVLAILLTTVVKTIYLDQISGITRALIIDAVWLAALVAAGSKLLKPFDAPVVDSRAFARPIANQRTQESPVTSTYQTGELPVNFRHDLQTPISMIYGFCNAILRADQNHSPALPSVYRDNVQAIYRNAQQLEKMIGDSLNPLKQVRIPDAEELDPVALIQEIAVLIQDLMAAHQITLRIKIDDPLPKLALHRISIRQVLLNVLRTIARVNNLPGGETLVTLQAKVQHTALHIIITAPGTSLRSATVDPNWSLNERLIERVGGRLWVKAVPDSTSDAYSNLVLALPIPSSVTSAEDRPTVLVISEEANVIDFLQEHLNQYEVIGVKDATLLSASAAQKQPVAVILTREQQASQMQAISDLVGTHTPIIACMMATAEEQLRRLNAVYLPKPVDYDALLSILTSTNLPIEHILIVEDNIDGAEMLALMLASMSPTFITWKAYLAQDALVLLDKHHISAIILDISLPDMDGITLVQLIRSREHFARLPIVLVSAQQSLEAMMPIIVSDKISLFQFSGFESSQLAFYIEALINSRGHIAPV